MPAVESTKTKKLQSSDRHSSIPTATSEASHANAGTDSILPSFQSQMENDFSEATFERHVALLGDPRMSQRMYDQQRVTIVRQIQRDYGNRYVQRLVSHIRQKRAEGIQIKLAVGPAGDKYEQEADRVAREVVRGIASPETREERVQRIQNETLALAHRIIENDNQRSRAWRKASEDGATERGSLTSTDKVSVQRQGLEDEELMQGKFLQRQGLEDEEQPQVGMEGGEVTPDVSSTIERAKGGGQALPDNVRGQMEQGFGTDFSGVKIHTGSKSDDLNKSMSARAFTTGNDIFFGKGEYDPGSKGGQETLAHELTHVVQQSGVRRKPEVHDMVSSIPQAHLRLTSEPGKTDQAIQRLGFTPFIVGGLVILGGWVATKLYNWNERRKELANDERERLEALNNLVERAQAGEPEALTDLSSNYFRGSYDDEIRINVQPIVENYVQEGIAADNLTPEQKAMLEIAEESVLAGPELRARAMSVLAAATPSWGDDVGDDIEDSYGRLTSADPMEFTIPTDAQKFDIAADLFEVSENGPIEISLERITSLGAGENALEGYDLERVIGKGISGNVALADAGDDHSVVVKKIKMSDVGVLRKTMLETLIQMNLNQGDVEPPYTYSRILRAIVVSKVAYIIMEPATGGDWENSLKENPPTPIILLEALEKLANGYQRMHDAGYAHRDVKPDNVLISENDLLISDFGESRPVREGNPFEDPGRSFDYHLFGKMIFEIVEQYGATLGLSDTERGTLESFSGNGILPLLLPKHVDDTDVPDDTIMHKLLGLGKKMFLKQMTFEELGPALNELVVQVQPVVEELHY